METILVVLLFLAGLLLWLATRNDEKFERICETISDLPFSWYEARHPQPFKEQYFKLFELSSALFDAERSKGVRLPNGTIDYQERNDRIKKAKRLLFHAVEEMK